MTRAKDREAGYQHEEGAAYRLEVGHYTEVACHVISLE